jgi:hypothetical protein
MLSQRWITVIAAYLRRVRRLRICSCCHPGIEGANGPGPFAACFQYKAEGALQTTAERLVRLLNLWREIVVALGVVSAFRFISVRQSAFRFHKGGRMREVIATNDAPKGYWAILAGHQGQRIRIRFRADPLIPRRNSLSNGDVAAQTERVLQNLSPAFLKQRAVL